MEYDGIIEYFDTSLVESGTEQESVPDSVFYDSTESLDFNDSVIELKTITANDEKISSTQQCDQQNSSRSGVVLCVVIVIVIVVITTVWRCMVHGKNNKVR